MARATARLRWGPMRVIKDAGVRRRERAKLGPSYHLEMTRVRPRRVPASTTAADEGPRPAKDQARTKHEDPRTKDYVLAASFRQVATCDRSTLPPLRITPTR